MRFALAVLVVMFAMPAQAACKSPTVREIESALGYYPGAQIPKDVPACGRGWHIIYERAKALGNGRYLVWIQTR